MNKKKSNVFKNLKITYSFTKGCRKYLLLCFIFTLLLSVTGAIIPMFTAKQIVFINNSIWDKLLFFTIMVLLFEMLVNTFRYFYWKFGQKFYRGTLTNIQIELSKETLKLETEELDSKTSGLFINRLNNDTLKLAGIFEDIIDTLTQIVTNLGILFAIFVINKIMFLYFLISITILFIINKIKYNKRFKKDKELRKINEKSTTLIGEMIRGLRDIKVLNAEDNFIKKLKKNILNSNEKRYELSEVDRRWTFYSGTFHDLFDFLFILLGIMLVTKDMLSIENLVIIYMYKERLYNILYFLSSMIEYMKDFELSSDRVFEVFDDEEFKKESFGNKKLKKAEGNIEFKDVSFSYTNKENIINNMSFKINPNEKVAFVGKSGQGKSTIFSLLAKLYHPNKGSILIDNIDINDLDKDSLRNNISIITQMPYIFNFSIKENLRIVKPNATNKEIVEACKLASLHDFIMNLPDKYDTLVGEGGITLSGGQRQRLAIARALLLKTEIIMFDEATSSLDNETQKEISEAIHNLKGEYTILIVAHRLSTVMDSDRIFVVDNGKIIATGTHNELIENCKFYNNLYDSEL